MQNIFRVKTKMIMPDGETRECEQSLLKETHLQLNVCGKKLTIVCTNTALKELIVGRLFCEGIIGSYGDVEDITISEFDNVKSAEPYAKNSDQGESGNKTIDKFRPDIVADLVLKQNEVKTPTYNRDNYNTFSPEDIFEIIGSFEDGGDLHGVTRSAHSCYISVGGKTVWGCEDISRHNALDKCIGYMLMNGIESKDCIVYTSGRVPLDMITKADQAGIRVLVAKAVPTDKSIEYARENKIVLIARARKDHFEVFL